MVEGADSLDKEETPSTAAGYAGDSPIGNIRKQFEALAIEISYAEEKASALIERIAPILSPTNDPSVPSDKAQLNPVGPERAEVANWVEAQRVRITALSGRLNAVEQRVDL